MNIISRTSVLYFLLAPIMQYYRVAKHKSKWRKKNQHNLTEACNIFPIEKVTVGEHTYGDITFYYFGGEHEYLRIGSYCSIAGNVKFLGGGEHAVNQLFTFPIKRHVYKEDAGEDTDDETGDDGADGDEESPDGPDTGDGETDYSSDDAGDENADGDSEEGGEESTETNDDKDEKRKKFNMYRRFIHLYNVIKTIIDKLKNVVKDDPVQNAVIKRVINNLTDVRDNMFDFMTVKYKSSSYVQILIFFETAISIVKLNFELVRNNKINLKQ